MSYTVQNFRADLEAPYAWPGGYPRFFITSDGAALSFDAAMDCAALIEAAIIDRDSSGWRVIACYVNWEDSELYCDHSNKRIESAYGDDFAETDIA